MKHLKSFNEEIKFDFEWDSECIRLQNIINSYNDKLIDDEVWKKFYHRIDDYYKKKLDSDFLESIIEFAKKRIKEIEKEKKDRLDIIKSIFDDFEDENEFVREYRIDRYFKDSPLLNMNVEIFLDGDFEDLVYKGLITYYTDFAIENIWPKLTILTKKLKSYDLDCFINYTLSKKINFRINETH
jgi:hypothetical protein